MITPLVEPDWLLALLPELILTVAGLVLILTEAMAPRARSFFAPISIIALVAAVMVPSDDLLGTFFGGTYEISPITRLFDLIFVMGTLLAILFAREYMKREEIESGEAYALLLWGTVGMMMMAKGLDLLIVILGLEILSVCIYVLVGLNRHIPVSNESSLKYFLMGAFATGFILYGTAFFYGETGSTHIHELATFMTASGGSVSPILTIAFILFIAGIGFKLALAPFHAWAPDVYQGAPTPIAAWLSAAPKAATLIALSRVFYAMLPVAEALAWTKVIAIMAILSMVIGNFVAIAQRDLKRMLAYSGIAHVGYMMIAMLVLREEAVAAISIYALTYTLMNIGAFGVISLLQKNQNDPQTLSDIAGLGFRRPMQGLALALFMFSLAGLPPTAGFISKFYIFKVAIESGALGIAIVGILTSVVSVYYYLRVVYFLYMKEADETVPATGTGIFAASGLALASIGILAIGIFPRPFFETARYAASIMMGQ